MSTPEKAQRKANLKAKVDQQRRKIELFEQRMNDKSGVEVDEELYGDLSGIMEEMTNKVEKKFPEDSFGSVFWAQQLQASRVNDYRQMRWHPAIIKWCLSMKMLSSSSYRASSGIVVLLSERTLRDYTRLDEV